jgi:sporulation protein YlmC with PRC-barrel domain
MLGQPESTRQIARFYERAERVSRPGPTGEGTAQISSSGSRDNVSYELASELAGKRVVARHGAEIGEVADLMVDFAGSQPAMAIISAEQIPSTSDHFAVPIRLLTPMPNERLAVNADRSAFEHAKPFQPNKLANVINSESHEIFRYER